MSNQTNVTEDFIFEFKEMGADQEVISRTYSEINSPIQCSKSGCKHPNLHIQDVISNMVTNNNITSGISCNGFEYDLRPCGAFFEVNAVDNSEFSKDKK